VQRLTQSTESKQNEERNSNANRIRAGWLHCPQNSQRQRYQALAKVTAWLQPRHPYSGGARTPPGVGVAELTRIQTNRGEKRMKNIDHAEAVHMNADGDFGFTTLHTGTTGNPAKKGMVIRWVWSHQYNTAVDPKWYDSPRLRSPWFRGYMGWRA
jgi:hypothetical protein